MRHKCSNRLFDRTANQRKALFRGLIASLIEHERIETTVAKAKAVKRLAEKIVTLGKKGGLSARRMAFAYVPNKSAVKKLFDEIGPRFIDRNGGYMRIIRTRNRIKDQAPLAVLEFIDYEERKQIVKKEPETKKAEPEAKKEAPKKKVAPVRKTAAKKKTATKKTAAKKPTTKKTTAKKKATAKKQKSAE